MQRTRCSIWVWAVGAIALTACGTKPDPVGSQQATVTEKTVDFNLVCDQMVAFFPVAQTVARKYVPSEFDLYLENGAAQIMVILQNCSHAEWDGEELAPLQMTHTWIRRDGPFEVLPIPGAVVTNPSFYWYPYSAHTTSKKLFLKFKQAGYNIAMADSISLGQVEAPVRAAKVVEKELPGGPIGFDYVRAPLVPFSTIPIGINHHIIGYQGWTPEEPNIGEKIVHIHDRGYILPTAWGSPVTITPNPKAPLAKFGSVLDATLSVDFELHFTATLTTTDLSE